ncbi:MAG TPA: glycoside hydrolase family 16 protein [Chthonomonadaceae bacterium]|nr:glycoside hydrolase family 16 protein [Chthonomonadaceae bacterium]
MKAVLTRGLWAAWPNRAWRGWLMTGLLLGISAASLPIQAQITRAPGTHAKKPPMNIQKKGWELVFHDEFDGDKLDTRKWIDSYPDNERTHSNNEQQYYAPDGYEVKDGYLRFIAEKRAMGGMPYTSGMISSYGKFSQKYGWFEIRARFPKGKGYWPAFWLLPETKDWPPEIDVLEILGHEPNKVYMTNHWKNANGEHEGKGDSFTGPDFSADFHTFAVDWEPTEIIWYVDGVERYRTTQHVPAEPMYILANLAVGGDWPGNPDETTPFPGYMDIDYIRVYQKANSRPAAR